MRVKASQVLRGIVATLLVCGAVLSAQSLPPGQGRIYVAAAVDDPFYPVEMNDRLERALTDAKVDYKAEFYDGALHGWTMTDFPIYNEPQAERHWRELFGLFKSKLS